MKQLFLIILFSLPLFGQTAIRSYSDSLYFGDSTNTHIFANPHSWLRITITEDTSSSNADTMFVYAGTTTSLLAQVGVKSAITANQSSDIVPGVVSGESTYKQYWLYIPGGAYTVKLVRCTTVLSKIKYTIESFN